MKPKNTNITNAVESRTSRHTRPLKILNGARDLYFAPKHELAGVWTAISYIKSNHRIQEENTALLLPELPPWSIDQIWDINNPGLAKQDTFTKELLWQLGFLQWHRQKTAGLCQLFCPYSWWLNWENFFDNFGTKWMHLGESRGYHIFTLKDIEHHETWKWRTKEIKKKKAYT